MAQHEIIIPKMGESIIEATITKWLKKEGDQILEEDPIVELATDKVDSEIPSPIDGKIIKILYQEGDVVPVGQVIAIVEVEGEGDNSEEPVAKAATEPVAEIKQEKTEEQPIVEEQPEIATNDERFYSPLVRSIAKKEGISQSELASITGTGDQNRVTKKDILTYIASRTKKPLSITAGGSVLPTVQQKAIEKMDGDEIVAMDRMRILIADHMVNSVRTSPHVTSFIEVDMEPVVQWRNKNKAVFLEREKEKLTFTPIFIEATARALRDFPGVNASVEGTNIILRKHVNIGMAASLPSGNLIVPVIHDADKMNLAGLAARVNDLAKRSRENKLIPDEIQGGTFTITNLGTFGSTTGTPIINQPQAAILGIGVIAKKPVVLETAFGDTIAIRHTCTLSLSYDHRIVDGALGGKFLQKVTWYLENFEGSRSV